jgi:hypothetical protein
MCFEIMSKIFSIVAQLVSASFHSLAKSLNAHRGVSIRFLIVACPVVDSRVIRSIISRCSIVRLCFILHNVGIIRRARDERYIHPMHDNRLQKLSARSDHDKLTPIRTDRYFRAIVMTCMFLPSHTVQNQFLTVGFANMFAIDKSLVGYSTCPTV